LSDLPIVGAFDGGGASDITVYRLSSGGWYILHASSGFSAHNCYT